MAKIITLKDKGDVDLYPQTVTSAVFTGSSQSIDAALTEIDSSIEDSQAGQYNSGWFADRVIYGEYYDVNGTIGTATNYRRLPLIKVSKEELVVRIDTESLGCRCFDEDGVFLDSATVVDNSSIALVENTVYIGLYWTKLNDNYVDNYIDLGSTLPAWIDTKLSISDIKDTFTSTSTESALSANAGKRLHDILLGQEIVSEQVPYESYALISGLSIPKGTRFSIKVNATNGWERVIIIYNTENLKRLLDSTNDSINGRWIDVEAPEDITSIGIGYIAADNSSFTVSVKLFGEIDIVERMNVLYGKKLVACGDSFTEYTAAKNGSPAHTFDNWDDDWNTYKTYPYWIARRNKMLLVNEAVSGSTITALTSNSFSKTGGRYTKLPKDADYIILKFGINDDAAHQNAPIGTIDDTENTTFYGAWNVVLNYLTTNHPNAKIGIIITNGADLTNLALSIPYMQATIEIAKKWGVSFLNEGLGEDLPLFYRSGRMDVSAEMRDLLYQRYRISGNDAHPCVEWHRYESTVVENWLRGL